MTDKEVWNTKDVVEHHIRTNDAIIPYRRDMLSIIARLATTSAPEKPRILDLGCGYGDVTAEILKISPQAIVCMVDFSEEMLKLTKKTFGKNKRIEIIKHDLDNGLPDRLKSGRFDAVGSCLALHHIEYENRTGLYKQIRQVLVENGLFVCGDRFTGESPAISEWEFDNWITWMTGQIKEKLGKDRPFDQVKIRQIYMDKKLGDKPGTLWDMQKDLKQVGFQYVDCVWKSHNMGIVVATDR